MAALRVTANSGAEVPNATMVNPITPYNRTTSPLTITATNFTPAENVTLYYRWSEDNTSWTSGWFNLYYDNFEDGTSGNYTGYGDDVSREVDATSQIDGTYSLELRDDTNNRWELTNVIAADTNSYSQIRVDYRWDIDSFEDSEDFWFEYYNNSASGWTRVSTYVNPADTGEDGDGSFTEWLNESEGFDLSDNLKIRWVCDASGDADFLFLDNIYINATYAGNGISWRKWDNPAQNPDESYPWSWNFNFPNGTGYYEFYSIGNISGSPNETAPISADAICVYNRPSTITNEGPTNESIDISIYPQLNITVNDIDGDTMTITWYSNSSGTWQVFGTNNTVSNGTYHQNNSNFSLYFTTFWWNVTVSDGFNINTSETFHFTTEHSTFIDVVPAQWDIGSTTVGNNNYSTSDFYFNLSNNGTTTLNIQIKASNATNTTTGAQWELNSTPGYDNYSLQYNKSGSGTWTNINLTYDTFVTNLAVDAWQTFDLNIFMATISTRSDPLSLTVTFRSVIS